MRVEVTQSHVRLGVVMVSLIVVTLSLVPSQSHSLGLSRPTLHTAKRDSVTLEGIALPLALPHIAPS